MKYFTIACSAVEQGKYFWWMQCQADSSIVNKCSSRSGLSENWYEE